MYKHHVAIQIRMVEMSPNVIGACEVCRVLAAKSSFVCLWPSLARNSRSKTSGKFGCQAQALCYVIRATLGARVQRGKPVAIAEGAAF